MIFFTHMSRSSVICFPDKAQQLEEHFVSPPISKTFKNVPGNALFLACHHHPDKKSDHGMMSSDAELQDCAFSAGITCQMLFQPSYPKTILGLHLTIMSVASTQVTDLHRGLGEPNNVKYPFSSSTAKESWLSNLRLFQSKGTLRLASTFWLRHQWLPVFPELPIIVTGSVKSLDDSYSDCLVCHQYPSYRGCVDLEQVKLCRAAPLAFGPANPSTMVGLGSCTNHHKNLNAMYLIC